MNPDPADPFQGHTIGRFKFYLHSRVHIPKDYTQITTAAKSSSSGHESAVLLCKKDESGMVTLGTLVSVANLCLFCRSLQLVTFLWEIHKSLLYWLIAPKVLLESLWPKKTIRPISSHSHIALKATSHELRWNKMRQDAPRWSKMH